MRPLIVIAILAAASPAAAQKFEYGKYDDVKDVKEVEWNATAEAGLVFTTGNSESMTATGGIKASRKTGKNKLTVEGSAAYAKSSVWVLFDRNDNGMIDNDSELMSAETLTAETLAGKLRYDRFLTELNSVFIAALASRDIPAGKELVFGGQIGYSRSLYKSAKALTVGEFGYDYSREDLVAPGDPLSIHSLRAFIGHKAAMTEGADLDASIELLTNMNTLDLPTGKDGGPLQDTRVNTKVAISAKIGKNLAFQTSLEAKYDHRPSPLGVKNLAEGFAPESSSLDTIMKASFIYTFVGTNK
ncbi:MAG TPA: DUF481 domain-containing protein [Kofleriaceae bacterium]|nr:DUF481 domain-containing protein [Kofleriaceae bacterium]